MAALSMGGLGNPTTRVCEEKIRGLEGAEDCLVSASGMNAATTMLLTLVPAGGHIVTTVDCYRGTRQFIETVLPKMGISATVIDPADLGALERALREHDVSALLCCLVLDVWWLLWVGVGLLCSPLLLWGMRCGGCCGCWAAVPP